MEEVDVAAYYLCDKPGELEEQFHQYYMDGVIGSHFIITGGLLKLSMGSIHGFEIGTEYHV